MSEAEAARTRAQVEALGPERLKQLGGTLAAAVAKNETPPPAELLASLPIPDAGTLRVTSIPTGILT